MSASAPKPCEWIGRAEVLSLVLALRRTGMGIERIAEQIGASPWTLRDFVRLHREIDWSRSTGRIALEADALNPPPGMSLADVARKHGVTKNVVSGLRARRKSHSQTP